MSSSSAVLIHSEDRRPWVEKYRPRSISDLVYQDEVSATLRRAVDTGNLPHLLFYGPPGTGKTSAALAVARELFGQEHYRTRVMELNASDERGIDVIRQKVKDFAQVAVSSSGPPFKLILLDEADSMTPDAQSALRRTMETYSNVTRFCLMCNYVSRIIDPITSRCAKFRFRPLSLETFQKRLRSIADQESFELETNAVEELERICDGDLRRGVTLLQASSSVCESRKITKFDIQRVAGTIPTELVTPFVQACQTLDWSVVDSQLMNLLSQGYPAVQIISQILHILTFESPVIPDPHKSIVLSKLAEVDFALAQGADEYLQLCAIAAHLMDMFRASD